MERRFFLRRKTGRWRSCPGDTNGFFILDADERITPELAAELSAIAANPCRPCEGYYVNPALLVSRRLAQALRYYPSWNLRFFRTAGPLRTIQAA